MLISPLTSQQINEEAIWIGEAQKDPRNFKPVYERYFNPVFRFVYQRMESKEETAEIVSQVFYKALKNLSRYSFRGLPFFAWLCRIAVSEIGNYYSRTKKYRSVNIETSGLNEIAENIEKDISEEQIGAILGALKHLPEEDLLLIEMRYFESRPFSQIGNILNITENNAKVKVYRILDKIRKIANRLTQ